MCLFLILCIIKMSDMRYSSFIMALLYCLYVSPQEVKKDRNYWMNRYFSVSYPLREIIVTSRFGGRRDPYTGKHSNHSGLDLQAYYEDVYAMFDGYVKKVGSDTRSGNYIILQHGLYSVSYCHLSKVKVNEGEKFIAGDVMAISGNTGRSTGPHLHITVRYKDEIIDPFSLLIYITGVRSEAANAINGGLFDLGNMSKAEFFEKHAPSAIRQQQLYGIPSSVTLAQMAFESFWGTSKLARIGRNYFGIKCSREWLAAGKPYSLHDDDRRNEKFCNYSSVAESIEHHSRILMSDRYKVCRRFPSTDFHNWLLSLKAAGYATDPDYVRKLEGIIKQYKLYLYDRISTSPG